MRVLRSFAVLAFVALVGLVAGACGTSTDPDLAKLQDELKALQQREQKAEVELAQIEEEGIDEPDTPTDTTRPGEVVADASKLGIAFYYAEFKVTLGTARVVPKTETESAYLGIDFLCENIGLDQGYCPDDVTVESNKNFYSRAGGEVPGPVPSTKTADGDYRFRIDEKFSLAGAVLLVGSAPRHVVSVPLCPGKDSVAPVLLEPVDLPASGTVTAGTVTATLTGMQLRADRLNHGMRDKDKLTLVLTLDVVARPSASCCYYIGHYNFAVKRPDGNTSEATNWSESETRVERDVNIKGALVYFEVDNPPAGTYSLEVLGKDDQSKDVVQTLAFSISEG